jgi:hypothetical protein
VIEGNETWREIISCVRVLAKNLSAMSAQNGDTTMQEDALDQEEELAFGEKKLVVVSVFHSF